MQTRADSGNLNLNLPETIDETTDDRIIELIETNSLIEVNSLEITTNPNLSATSTHHFITKKFQDLRSQIFGHEPASMRAAWPMRVVLPTVLESSFILTSAGISYYFMDSDTTTTAWLKTPFSPAALVILFNTLFRTLNFDSNFLRLTLSKMPRCAMTFIAGYTTHYTILHEGSHAASTFAFFQNPQPKISIKPSYFGAISGNTQFNMNELTALGQRLGVDASKTIFSAAGMSASMLEAFLFLILSKCMPDEWSETKDFLRMNALVNIFGVMSYFLNPYVSNCEVGNDACSLDQAGFPPYAGILLVLLSTSLLELALHFIPQCYSQLKNKINQHEEEPDELEPSENDISAMRLIN